MGYYQDKDNDLGAELEALEECLEADLSNLIDNSTQVYSDNKKSLVGTNINCPTCGKVFVKKSYQQTFCKGKCKDRYHNSVNEKRKARAKLFNAQNGDILAQINRQINRIRV